MKLEKKIERQKKQIERLAEQNNSYRSVIKEQESVITRLETELANAQALAAKTEILQQEYMVSLAMLKDKQAEYDILISQLRILQKKLPK